MDQTQIGAFLKSLRKEKELTQEQLAERLNVSNRTVSRWETGANMPDIGLLVEIADFYAVSIPEIIDGKRRSENMDQEVKDTAVAMAEYSKNEVENRKKKTVGILLSLFGIFIIMSALAVFPNESSWGSIYSILGGMILIIGVSLILRQQAVKRGMRVLAAVGCMILLFGCFTFSDYVAVKHFNQVPRFRYETHYDSLYPDQLVHKTLFYDAVQINPGKEDEQVIIVSRKR